MLRFAQEVRAHMLREKPCPVRMSVIPFDANEFVFVGECFGGRSLRAEYRHKLQFDHGNKQMLGFKGYCHLAEASGLGLMRDAYRASRQWKIEIPNGKWPIRMPFVMTECEFGDHDETALVKFELWSSGQYWPTYTSRS